MTFLNQPTHRPPFLTQGIQLLVAAGHVLADRPDIATQVLGVVVLGHVCGGLTAALRPLLPPTAGVRGFKQAILPFLVCTAPVIHTGCTGLGKPPFVYTVEHRAAVTVAF